MLTPIHLKLFQKIAEEGTLPNLSCEATITWISKPAKDTKKKKKKKTTPQTNSYLDTCEYLIHNYIITIRFIILL